VRQERQVQAALAAKVITATQLLAGLPRRLNGTDEGVVGIAKLRDAQAGAPEREFGETKA
jgi:hypothetical protein